MHHLGASGSEETSALQEASYTPLHSYTTPENTNNNQNVNTQILHIYICAYVYIYIDIRISTAGGII